MRSTKSSSNPMAFVPRLLFVLLCAILLGSCASAGPNPTPTIQPTNTQFSSPTVANSPAGATVTLGASAFAQSDVMLSAGQTLRIVDPSATGGTHVLCLGAHGTCDDAAQGPDLLRDPGVTLHAGDTKDIVFTSAGIYQITCTIHPEMLLTVSVLGVG